MSTEPISAITALTQSVSTETKSMPIPPAPDVARMESAMGNNHNQIANSGITQSDAMSSGNSKPDSISPDSIKPGSSQSSSIQTDGIHTNSVKSDDLDSHSVKSVTPLEKEVVAVDKDSNLADKVLDGFQKIKTEHSAGVDAINQSLTDPNLDVQSLMSLQMEIARLTLQEDLLAKTASKSTQNLDSLLKTQKVRS